MAYENKLSVQATLMALEGLVQRMAETRGQRTIAMISDGFFDGGLQYRMDDLVDRAMRANVVVNTLDARGVWVGSNGGNVREMEFRYSPSVQLLVNQITDESKTVESGPLGEVAEATGGVFIHNTNDMEDGLAQISELNVPSYLLGFSPGHVKPDGRFHRLQVKLTAAPHYTVEARRGYFAPQKSGADHNTTLERMEEAAFSEGNLDGFPLQLVTKIDSAGEGGSLLHVVVDVDMRQAQFLKQGGQNVDEAEVLVFVFKNGQYVESRRQSIKLRLSDKELEDLRRSGGEADVQFTLKPGDYVVRAVLGDSNSTQLGAASKNVTIP